MCLNFLSSCQEEIDSGILCKVYVTTATLFGDNVLAINCFLGMTWLHLQKVVSDRN